MGKMEDPMEMHVHDKNCLECVMQALTATTSSSDETAEDLAYLESLAQDDELEAAREAREMEDY